MYVDADDIGDGQWVKGRYVSVRYVYMYICMYLPKAVKVTPFTVWQAQQLQKHQQMAAGVVSLSEFVWWWWKKGAGLKWHMWMAVKIARKLSINWA